MIIYEVYIQINVLPNFMCVREESQDTVREQNRALHGAGCVSYFQSQNSTGRDALSYTGHAEGRKHSPLGFPSKWNRNGMNGEGELNRPLKHHHALSMEATTVFQVFIKK